MHHNTTSAKMDDRDGETMTGVVGLKLSTQISFNLKGHLFNVIDHVQVLCKIQYYPQFHHALVCQKRHPMVP